MAKAGDRPRFEFVSDELCLWDGFQDIRIRYRPEPVAVMKRSTGTWKEFWPHPASPRVFPISTGPEGQSATQSATQSDAPLLRLLGCLVSGEKSAGDLRNILHLSHRATFRKNYLHPALKKGLIEYTIPGKPTSRLQRYRLTEKGRATLNSESENADK